MTTLELINKAYNTNFEDINDIFESYSPISSFDYGAFLGCYYQFPNMVISSIKRANNVDAILDFNALLYVAKYMQNQEIIEICLNEINAKK